MFKCTANSLNLNLRRLHTINSRSTSGRSFDRRLHSWVLVSSTVTATALWFSTNNVVHNDVHPPESIRTAKQLQAEKIGVDTDSDVLYTLLWGSNK